MTPKLSKSNNDILDLWWDDIIITTLNIEKIIDQYEPT